MNIESFVNSELADVDLEGSVTLASSPVMTAAAFMAGIAVASATVAAYEAGAGD